MKPNSRTIFFVSSRISLGVVASMGWSVRSAILIGGDTLPRKKPDPDQLFLACETLGVAPGECVYVGDDERDIVAARNADEIGGGLVGLSRGARGPAVVGAGCRGRMAAGHDPSRIAESLRCKP